MGVQPRVEYSQVPSFQPIPSEHYAVCTVHSAHLCHASPDNPSCFVPLWLVHEVHGVGANCPSSSLFVSLAIAWMGGSRLSSPIEGSLFGGHCLSKPLLPPFEQSVRHPEGANHGFLGSKSCPHSFFAGLTAGCMRSLNSSWDCLLRNIPLGATWHSLQVPGFPHIPTLWLVQNLSGSWSVPTPLISQFQVLLLSPISPDCPSWQPLPQPKFPDQKKAIL